MWNLITLDGYFEGDKNWDLSFHDTIWGPELEKISIEQLKAADYLVLVVSPMVEWLRIGKQQKVKLQNL